MDTKKPGGDRLERIERAVLALALLAAVSWAWASGDDPVAGLLGRLFG